MYLATILSPIAFLGLNLLAQAIYFRLSGRSAGYLSTMLVGTAVGAAAQLTHTIIMTNSLPLFDVVLISCGLLWIYGCLSFGLFAFANLGEASLRVKILRVLKSNPYRFDNASLRQIYGESYILDRRLDRLQKNQQIKNVNGYLSISGHSLVILLKLMSALKYFLTRSKSEFERVATQSSHFRSILRNRVKVSALLSSFIFWLMSVLIAATVVLIALDPKYAATFSEYLFKFLPALADGGINATFDTVLLGDPRPRILSNLFALLNIHIRQTAFSLSAFIPAMSINWIIYPFDIFLLYKAISLAWNNPRVASTVAIIYAASPAALDILCDYYVPAKPLANFSMICVLYCLAKALKESETTWTRRSSFYTYLGATVLLGGLLCDETAAFSYLLVPAVFHERLTGFQRHGYFHIAIASLIPVLAYIAIGFLLLPALNDLLGQAPLDFWRVATQGIFSAVFDIKTDNLWGGVGYSPINLIETIISAHTVPWRTLPGNWTSLEYHGILDWKPYEQAFLAIVFLILSYLYHHQQRGNRLRFFFLFASFLAFCFAQAWLIKPLSPVLLEVNYYASASSLWFSLMAGLLISGGSYIRSSIIKHFFLMYLVTVSLTNYLATAQRHPYASKPDPTWSDISKLQEKVKAGQFEEVIKTRKFPDRGFMWAYEMEVARRSLAGQLVDLVPHGSPEGSIISTLPKPGTQDPTIFDPDSLPNLSETELKNFNHSSLVALSEFQQKLLNTTIQGFSEPWQYIRIIDSSGRFKERVWYEGIVRQWQIMGKVEYVDGVICMRFANLISECIYRVFTTPDGSYYAYSSNGNPVTRFRIMKSN